jgi:hypothetical protein
MNDYDVLDLADGKRVFVSITTPTDSNPSFFINECSIFHGEFAIRVYDNEIDTESLVFYKDNIERINYDEMDNTIVVVMCDECYTLSWDE